MCLYHPPASIAGVAAPLLVTGCDEQDGSIIRLVSDETVQQLGLV